MKQRFIDLLPDKNICICGLQGSRMLGLAQTNDADYDYRGIYIEENINMLGLSAPKETLTYCDPRDDEMDYVFHELGKFFRLALKGNPSVLHLLFLPEYNILSDAGKKIVANREIFLGEKHIRSAFGGYALSQILYLKRNHKFTDGKSTAEKISKHVRHCFRLFDTGKELLETGKMTLPLKDPQKYIEIGKITDEEELTRMFEERDKEFQSCKSVLPPNSDAYLANKLLLDIRMGG